MQNAKKLDLERAFAEEYLVKSEDILWALDEMNQQWFERVTGILTNTGSMSGY